MPPKDQTAIRQMSALLLGAVMIVVGFLIAFRSVSTSTGDPCGSAAAASGFADQESADVRGAARTEALSIGGVGAAVIAIGLLAARSVRE